MTVDFRGSGPLGPVREPVVCASTPLERSSVLLPRALSNAASEAPPTPFGAGGKVYNRPTTQKNQQPKTTWHLELILTDARHRRARGVGPVEMEARAPKATKSVASWPGGLITLWPDGDPQLQYSREYYL